jgi:hypothetical protein
MGTGSTTPVLAMRKAHPSPGAGFINGWCTGRAWWFSCCVSPGSSAKQLTEPLLR